MGSRNTDPAGQQKLRDILAHLRTRKSPTVGSAEGVSVTMDVSLRVTAVTIPPALLAPSALPRLEHAILTATNNAIQGISELYVEGVSKINK